MRRLYQSLTQLGGVGVWQALQVLLHLGLGHLVQVEQGSEAVELLQPLPGPLRDLAGLHLVLRKEREKVGVEDVTNNFSAESPESRSSQLLAVVT